MTAKFRPPRRLQVYAFDPSTARAYKNRKAAIVTVSLPYEMERSDPHKPFLGPRGNYFEVVDYDPASDAFYTPIDLNAAEVLHNDGLPPSPEDPRFHQQMVYAVAMNTVAVFEEALGRVVQWAPRVREETDAERKARHEKLDSQGKEVPEDDPVRWVTEFTQRLRIYPHALREANAFYEPGKQALLFGYFTASANSKSAPPGTTVFTCLSHDIVVHETVHAILDGMHPNYAENSGPDMRALHEAFADIISLFQIFSFPKVLEDQIGKTRGELDRQSLLGQLAQEFGQAVGRGGALRDFLGNFEDGEWKAKDPDPTVLRHERSPHKRGAVLVAAVFRAFLTIYKHRVEDLFRIASGGSGVIRDGALDPDLRRRLAAEAAQCARRVMRICIRAMDYTPPVNVTFGDYLRAIITADHDLFPEDAQGYRAAFLEAFVAWGILPKDMSTISEPNLHWPNIGLAEAERQATKTELQLKAERRLEHGRNQKELAHEAENPDAWLRRLEGNLGLMLTRPKDVLSWLASPMRLPLEGPMRANFLRETEAARNESIRVGELIRGRAIKLKQDASAQTMTLAGRTKNTVQPDFNLLEIDDSRERVVAFHASRHYEKLLWLLISRTATPRFAELVGLCLFEKGKASIWRSATDGRPSIHVAGVRIAKRMGQRGQTEREYVVEIVQTRRGYFDPEKQLEEDALEPGPLLNRRPHDFLYRAGSTFLIDARSFEIRRLIRTRHRIDEADGLVALRSHLTRTQDQTSNAFWTPPGAGAQAFTDLHRTPGQMKKEELP